MRRWNGWGDDANHYPMPDGGQAFLESQIDRDTSYPMLV